MDPRIKGLNFTELMDLLNNDPHLYGPLIYGTDWTSEPRTESKCTCGAKHTSFPKHHLAWCDKINK